jgi:hypothetical protein
MITKAAAAVDILKAAEKLDSAVRLSVLCEPSFDERLGHAQ